MAKLPPHAEVFRSPGGANPYNAVQNNRFQPYTNIPQNEFQFWGAPIIVADRDFPLGIKRGDLYCPGFNGKTYADNAWDTVFMGLVDMPIPFTPGIAEVSIHKSRDVIKDKKPGSDGARITLSGIEPALVEIRLIIWTPEQLKALKKIWIQIFPSTQKNIVTQQKVPGSKKKTINVVTSVTDSSPVDIDHPLARIHNVTQVIFTGGEGPVQGGPSRSRIFTMHAVEYIPENKIDVTSTPKGSRTASPVQPLGATWGLSGANPENTNPNPRSS